MRTAEQHIEQVLRVARMPSAAIAGAGNTALIHRSWSRCINEYGLDPTRPANPRVESSNRLRERREQIEDYLHVARAGMEQMFKHVSSLGYAMLLTDADGVTIDYIGNDSWDRKLFNAGLQLGVDWKESVAGTNGVGTCVVEQQPLTCHRYDHFYPGHMGLSCTATSLFDPDGDFMGVLDVSALSTPEANESQHLALHLTQLYGRMIEDANFMRRFRDRWILRLGAAWALVEVASELMLAFDADGVIVGANSGARANLQLPRSPASSRLVGRHLSEIFGSSMDDIWRLQQAPDTQTHSLLSVAGQHAYHASIVPPRSAPPRSGSERVAEAVSEPLAECPALDRLAGEDRTMQRVLDRAKRLVDKPLNILIQGETGTGKEVFARALHESSKRAGKPFIAVNCASIPESLIESELFGYMPGTFTGARSRGMRGLIAQSDGGTLFLDEIGDMPLNLQTRLLRVLSEREVLPLGADRPLKLQLTVFAASHHELRKLIVAGHFREDLYYRLCGATLSLPPLRERRDRPYLVQRILREEAEALGARARIDERAVDQLMRYAWPGNLRQLRNVIRFALAVSDGQGIFVEHLPPELAEEGSALPPMSQVLAEVRVAVTAPAPTVGSPEAQFAALLRRHRWNITAVGRELGLSRPTVYKRMREFGIVSPRQL